MVRYNTDDFRMHSVGFGGNFNRPAQRDGKEEIDEFYDDWRTSLNCCELGQGGHDWSATGIVVRSKNPHVNTIVVKCTKCMGRIRRELQQENPLCTAHAYLARWYQQINPRRVCNGIVGFSIKDNGDIGYNSLTFNVVREVPQHLRSELEVELNDRGFAV